MMLAVLVIATTGVGAHATYGSYLANNSYENNLLLSENVEALSVSDGCLSGGPGSTACSHSGGIGVTVVGSGGSTNVECSVTCGTGYYACCTAIGCKCVKTQQKKK